MHIAHQLDAAAGASADGGAAALVDLAGAILDVARSIAPHDVGVTELTGTEATVMRWVHRNPGVSPSETAAATGLRRSNLSAALRGLEAKGMVERRRSASDARQFRLTATALAEDDIARLHGAWIRCLGDALGDDRRDLDRVIEVLRRIGVALRD